MKPIRLFDSKSKKKEDFQPIKEGQVRIYVCGPTVYDDSHLGHARSSIVFDLLKRMLSLSGYEVILVKNFTDIDDKIINKSIQNKIDPQTIAQTYIKSYLSDMDALKVIRPDKEPKATESLYSISDMIQTLLDKNFAYQTPNGDIYLEVNKDDSYGSISNRGIDDENLSRVTENESKKDARDFSLWKAYKGKNDIGYESYLGFGRPGWHIECSAMIKQHLAYENEKFCIDIHGGGTDLLFPHHENEASQTRLSTNQEIAKYWIHNNFVNINGEKMSKSLGNSFFVKDALKIYDGEILRNYLIATHYRSILSFNEEDLLASKKRLDKIYRLKKRVQNDTYLSLDFNHQKPVFQLPKNDFQEKFLKAMQDDLNISEALSVLEEMLSTANQKLDKNPKDKTLKEKIYLDLVFVQQLLGIGCYCAQKYFQLGVDETLQKKIEDKIAQRLEAKQNKDYTLADAIRLELQELGILILDTPTGTQWEKNWEEK